MQALFSTLASQCAELRSEVGRLQAQVENQRAELQHYVTRLPELQEALAAAQRDKERLDRISAQHICLTPLGTAGKPPEVWCATLMPTKAAWFRCSLREAIDAVPEGVTK